MKCSKKYLLPDYIQGKLSQMETTTLREHINECEICAHEYKNLNATIAKIKSERQTELDEVYWINLLPEIYKKINSKKFSYHQRYVPQIVISAAVLIIVSLLMIKLFDYHKNSAEIHKNIDILSLIDSVDQGELFYYTENITSNKSDDNNSDDFVFKNIILTSHSVEELYKDYITITELKEDELNYLLTYLDEEKKYKR